MTDATAQRGMDLLQQLADKLEVSITVLWQALVTQQYLEGYTNLIVHLSVIIISLILAVVVARTDKCKKAWNKCERDLDFFDIASCVTVVGSAIVFLAAVLFLVLSVTGYITQIINPNYHALMELKGFF